MNVETILFALLRMEICGEAVSEEIKAAISPEILEPLFELSRKHSVAQIVGNALSKLGVLGQDEASVKFRKSTMGAVTRYIQMSNAYYCICDALEKAQIPFLPLKGLILRDWYPEPWMRTSSDIDILVKREDLEFAAGIVSDKLGYQKEKEESHDISFYSPAGIHLELHFNLIEDSISQVQSELLSRIWDVVHPAEGYTYKMIMPMSWFRFYHISHMAKHVKYAGCGIRPLIDLWIIDHRVGYDVNEEEELITKGCLVSFEKAAKRLSEHWLSRGPLDELSRHLGDYILGSGTHGTARNIITIRQRGKVGKVRYALARVFKPRDSLRKMYPVLEKYKWLYPLCMVHRWLHILCDRKLRTYAVWELKEHADTSAEEIRGVSYLLEQLEIENKKKPND